jgi:capsid protein
MKNFFARHLPTFVAALRPVARLFQPIVARLESAYQQWGTRRWLQTTFQDARFEFDFAAVHECCRKHLDLVENTPIIQKIRNLKIQFGVGVGGLKLIPNAGDTDMDSEVLEAWNEARSAGWERWARTPELGSNLSLSELTVQWEGSLFDVGNVLVQKTRDENGQPKIQTIDFLRLQTPPRLAGEEGKTIIQGVRLTKINVPARVDGVMTTREVIIGKPASYFIRDEFDPALFTEVPASQIIHKFRAIRPGMMVGLPESFSVINKIIDYGDLHILTMGAAKIAGKIANVHKTISGEFDTLSSRRAGMKTQSSQGNGGTPATKSYSEFYDVSLGAEEYAIPIGQDIKNFQVVRPSPAEQDYWQHIISEICAGYNVPKLLVFPFSLQGTVTRADLDVCANAFRSDFEIIASIVREIYEWQSQWAIRFDRSLDGTVPANPLQCVIRPPRAPNVDIGYTAKALEIELRLGIKTIQDVCADKNEDWHVVLRQVAESMAYIKRLEKEYGLLPGQISSLEVPEPISDPTNKADKTPAGEEESTPEARHKGIYA